MKPEEACTRRPNAPIAGWDGDGRVRRELVRFDRRAEDRGGARHLRAPNVRRRSQAKARKPRPEASPFGDYEKVEAVKDHSQEQLADHGDLPESYGEPTVTLLVVDPYLVHVYWDFDLAKLPPETTSAALRFYDVTDGPISSRFDVEIDLRARNWYVHLWSPARSYCADLGVKTGAGTFTPLVRSNTVQTPRAWPVAEVDRHFISAGAGSPRSEAAAPPPSEPVPSQTLALNATPVPLQRTESPEAAKPPAEADSAVSVAEPPPAPRVHNPAGAAETLQKKLSEIYALRQWPQHPSRNDTDSSGVPPADARGSPPGLLPAEYPSRNTICNRSLEESGRNRLLRLPGPGLPAKPDAPGDLTALTERQFSPGLSS